MITRLEGELVRVERGRAEVRCEHLTYELLIPAADEMRLSAMVGARHCFHTLHYLEGQGQGASYLPRLVGFSSPQARAFFELFTTVRGLGTRKALRALQLPFASVAQAIAAKDLSLLVSLPEIGKRTAETIIAELHGKVDRFVEAKPLAGQTAAPPGGPAPAHRLQLIADAVAILAQLGETRLTARQLVDRALEADPRIGSADEAVSAALQLKQLV